MNSSFFVFRRTHRLSMLERAAARRMLLLDRVRLVTGQPPAAPARPGRLFERAAQTAR